MNSTSTRADSATPIAAILLVFGSGVLFSCLDASAKYLVLSGMSAPFITWMRFAVHVVLVLVLLRSWSDRSVFRVKNLPMQLLRGVFLFGSTIFNFVALKTLPLADAMAIYFFAPMVITALAGPLLGEWAGWRRWVAIGIGFVGILVVTRPGFSSFGMGHVYALCSTLSYCLYVLMTRHMGATESSGSLIFYSAITPVVFMTPLVSFSGALPHGALAWLLLLLLGCFGALGHWLLIRAYKLAPASALAPYPYLQMVWATAFGYFVFADVPDRYTMTGAAIIILSGLYIVHRERQLRLVDARRREAETGAGANRL